MDKTTLRKRGHYDDLAISRIKPKLQEAIKHNLNYYEAVQKKMDAQQTKTASIQIRKQWLEMQKIHNYQNAYDRIRGLIALNVVKDGDSSVDGLRQRAKELKNLGAKVIDHIVSTIIRVILLGN